MGSPWATPAAGGLADTSGWGQGGGAAPGGSQDYVDSGTWDQPATGGDSSWTDNTAAPDSSWDSGGGGGWDTSGGGSSDDTF